MSQTMSCIIVGANGFLGSAIAAEAERRGYLTRRVTRSNYAAFRQCAADLLINAAGNSRKFLDERDPREGYALSVHSTMHILHDFRYEFFVQLSSGAVYADEGDPAANFENAPFDVQRTTRYGFHKRLAELLVEKYAPHYLILRLGGFVGPGLRKNAVYDLLTGQPLRVHPDSEFQFMDTRDFARLLFDFCLQPPPRNDLFNFAAQGTVSVRRVAEWTGRTLSFEDETLPRMRAELNLTKISRLMKMPSSIETVKNFIREIKDKKVVL